MKTLKERLKSPIIWIQIIAIVVGVIVYFRPEFEETTKVISTAVVSLINLLAGLNNPADKENF